MNASTDRIERKILLKAPRSRVWRALSNAEEFGDWFGVDAEGQDLRRRPARAGADHLSRLRARHLRRAGRTHGAGALAVLALASVPPIDPDVDYSKEPTTLVEFELKEVEGGTLLTRRRIRLRQDPAGAPPGGVPHEQRRLGRADEEHREACRHALARPRRCAPKTPALQNSAPIFAALGDETRLRLVAVLCAGGAMSIAQLTAGTDITRQAVTKHLQVLADAGLVRDVKVGRERLWEFEPARLDEARRSLDAIAAAVGSGAHAS